MEIKRKSTDTRSKVTTKMKGTSYNKHKKIMREIIGKSWEHQRTTKGKPKGSHRKTIGKPWKTKGKPQENPKKTIVNHREP